MEKKFGLKCEELEQVTSLSWGDAIAGAVMGAGVVMGTLYLIGAATTTITFT